MTASLHRVNAILDRAQDNLALEKEFGPDLIAAGWVDAGTEGARVTVPGLKFPFLVRWCSPDDGLYYQFRDALRMGLGQSPRTPGVAREVVG